MSADQFDPAWADSCPCKSFSFGGGRCELQDGHEGEHFRAWRSGDGGFSWTDQGQRRVADQWGSGAGHD
jgi:hypothetical protein